MSEAPLRVCLLGASGLVGQAVIAMARERATVRLSGIVRREVPLPAGARVELVLAPTEDWGAAMAQLVPTVVICALGTTRASAGSEAAFRAVDVDLVADVARKAKSAGVSHFVLVSSVGADASSRNSYLRAKGDAEAAVAAVGFRRLDVARPGLLRGARTERRPAERAAQVLAPLTDLLLWGGLRRYRSIHDVVLAQALLAMATLTWPGRVVHEHDHLLGLTAK